MPHTSARMATRDRDAGLYQRHRPEQTLLYRIVDEYYPVFVARLAKQGKTLPGHVQREVWAQRLRRVFKIDIETCSACGGAVKVIACIEDSVVIKQILDHLKNQAGTVEPKALAESRAPPVGLSRGLFD